jgi:hypothetical protein
MEERLVRSCNLKTLNDLKILQMGWIYDINFPFSFRENRERNCLQLIFNTLPSCDRTAMVYRKVSDYLARQCGNRELL